MSTQLSCGTSANTSTEEGSRLLQVRIKLSAMRVYACKPEVCGCVCIGEALLAQGV